MLIPLQDGEPDPRDAKRRGNPEHGDPLTVEEYSELFAESDREVIAHATRGEYGYEGLGVFLDPYRYHEPHPDPRHLHPPRRPRAVRKPYLGVHVPAPREPQPMPMIAAPDGVYVTVPPWISTGMIPMRSNTSGNNAANTALRRSARACSA